MCQPLSVAKVAGQHLPKVLLAPSVTWLSAFVLLLALEGVGGGGGVAGEG